MNNYIPLWIRAEQMANNFPECYLPGPQRKIFDFIKQDLTEEEVNSVGMSWKNAIAIEPHWSMAHIAVSMGLFPSVNLARKNGWNRPIEMGYGEYCIRKKLIFYFIWNPPGE